MNNGGTSAPASNPPDRTVPPKLSPGAVRAMVEDVAALVAEEESMESALEAALHQYLGVEVDGGE